MPCHHIAAVIQHHYPDWKGFSHHDCSLEWWKIWHSYAYNTKARGVSSVLSQARKMAVTGPSFPSSSRDPPVGTGTYAEVLRVPLFKSIRNYNEETLNKILRNPPGLEGSLTTQYEGLSQSSNILDENGGNNDFAFGGEDLDDDMGTRTDGVFTNLLDPSSGTGSGYMFELLKHNFYKLLNVLECHNKDFPERKRCNEIMGLLQSQTNAMRKEIIEGSKKRPAADNETINIMTEARARSLGRSYHSKNC